MRALAGLTIGFFVLAVVFHVLERRFAARAAAVGPLRRAGARTDLLYFAMTPLLTKSLSRIAVGIALVPLLVVWGVPLERQAIEGFLASRTWVSSLPVPVQMVAALVLSDLLGYWTHRLFHGKRLWAFHAVHHSSTTLDWLASVRVHPVNDALSKIAHAIPLLAIGFRPGVLASVLPIITLYAVLLHANVRWTFGPLRKVFASPVFHQWHHGSEDEAIDKNFAGMFPVFDILFGTYHMPEGRLPGAFGISPMDGERPMPEGFLAQLVYPFRAGGPG